MTAWKSKSMLVKDLYSSVCVVMCNMATLLVTLLSFLVMSTALPSKGTWERSTGKTVLPYDEVEFTKSFGHFRNGSYKIHDVLKELQANKTIGQNYMKK